MDSGGDEWIHLHYPAIDADGRACAESRIPLVQLLETRRTVPAPTWSSLWQGDPTPETGSVFPADKLHEFDDSDLQVVDPNTGRKIKTPMRYYGASDYAVSEDAGDFTVHIVVGVDPSDTIHIMDVWRKQAGPAEAIDAMIAMMAKWQPMCWAQEKGVLDKALGPFMTRRMHEEKAWIHIVKYPSATDKVTRVQSILGRLSMDKVKFRKASWWPALRAEIIRFPHGKHDDQVDALSLIGRMLAGMVGGSMPPGAAPPGRVLTVGGQPVAPYNMMTMNDLWDEEESLRPRRRRRR